MSVSENAIENLAKIYRGIGAYLAPMENQPNIGPILNKLTSILTQINYLGFELHSAAEQDVVNKYAQTTYEFYKSLQELNFGFLLPRVETLAKELVDIYINIGNANIDLAYNDKKASSNANLVFVNDDQKSTDFVMQCFSNALKCFENSPLASRDAKKLEFINASIASTNSDLNRLSGDRKLSNGDWNGAMEDYKNALAYLDKIPKYLMIDLTEAKRINPQVNPNLIDVKRIDANRIKIATSISNCFWSLGDEKLNEKKYQEALQCFARFSEWANKTPVKRQADGNELFHIPLKRSLTGCSIGLGEDQVDSNPLEAMQHYAAALAHSNAILAGKRTDVDVAARKRLCANISSNLHATLRQVIDLGSPSSFNGYFADLSQVPSRENIKEFLSHVINDPMGIHDHFRSNVLAYFDLIKKFATAEEDILSEDLLNIYMDLNSEERSFAFDQELEELRERIAQIAKLEEDSTIVTKLTSVVPDLQQNQSEIKTHGFFALPAAARTAEPQSPEVTPLKTKLQSGMFKQQPAAKKVKGDNGSPLLESNEPSTSPTALTLAMVLSRV